MRRIAAAAATLSLTIAACASHQEQAPPPPAAQQAPDGCGKNFPANARLIKLAPTREPKGSDRKDHPFQFANEIKVHGDLVKEGAWTDFNDGWSTLALRIASADATSLALHLTKLQFPARTQLWFCSADNHYKQGPYREAVGGEPWTPVVLGAEAKLQIDVPTADRRQFTGELAEAFGGFR
jgi:hypothetical protein